MNKKEIRKPAGKAGLPEETGRRLAEIAAASEKAKVAALVWR